jgi:hypothetical protein
MTLASAQAVAPVHRGEGIGSTPPQLRPGETLFQPDQKRALAFHSDELVISLVNGPKNLALDIEKTSHSSGRVELPTEIVQVNEIRATDKGKAIVIGMVNGSVYEVVILNTAAATIIDTFLAYSPSVSPDGHFIAFVKFYPAHFVEGTDDHYLLYDVLRSAGENRPINGSVADRANVGIPVYPLDSNRSGDNTGVAPPQQHHMLAQTFFWESDSSTYVFADDHSGEWALLLVSIRNAMPNTRKVSINKSQTCAPLHTEDCQITLRQAEVTPTSVIGILRGVGADSALEQTVVYQYERFSAIR